MDLDLRFSKFEIITGAGTALLCLLFISVFTEASAIENQIVTDVTQAVASDELYWSSVEANGQSIVLAGAAPDIPAKNDAAMRASLVEGVTSVENNIEIIGQGGTCQKQLDEYLNRETVRFKSGKADVVEESYPVISMLAMIVRTCTTRIEVAGHTDSKGDAEVNQRLSQRRADKVAKLLVSHGVPADKIRSQGYGEAQPVADNASIEGRKINRRIEFRVLGDAA